ncbi:MAG: hypothetical protein VZQ29_01965 [Succiniclasticum sp.]|nr:hypothetical protein [Succiniclasticum sp.]
MYNKKSVYALNKHDAEAIVYPSVEGEAVRLTRQDFNSDTEFMFWKQWSDQDYREKDNADVQEARYTIPIDLLPEHVLSAPGVEQQLLLSLDRFERGKLCAETIHLIRQSVTELQYRRMWLYYVEGLTQQEIAVHESVGQQRISVSLTAAKKRIKKYLSPRKK